MDALELKTGSMARAAEAIRDPYRFSVINFPIFNEK